MSLGFGFANELSPYRGRTVNALKRLRQIDDTVEALEHLIETSPDVSMAVNNFVRLSNQGHEMAFYGTGNRNKKRRLADVEDRWREFAARINAMSNAGLDGLIDMLHRSAYVRGAQACEVEVAQTLDDVVDVHVISPQSVKWKLETRNGGLTWVPYQQQSMKEVDLSKANFLWVPVDPLIDDPRGTLLLAPSIGAEDFQMQIRSDIQAVLHNQGWPRYDIKIIMERVLANMPPDVKGNKEKRSEYLQAILKAVNDMMRGLKPDDSFVHFDEMEFGKMQGGEVTRSIDIRATNEMLDVQTMSGLKQMGIFLNRVSGTTETWSSVQFRIFTSMIASIQRGSKRLIEEVARIWLQTQGIQAVPKFTHKTIDWQAELEKAEVKLAWQQFWLIAQQAGWVDADMAAQEAVGVEKAAGQPMKSGGSGGNNDAARNAIDAAIRNGRLRRNGEASAGVLMRLLRRLVPERDVG